MPTQSKSQSSKQGKQGQKGSTSGSQGHQRSSGSRDADEQRNAKESQSGGRAKE